MKRRSKRLRKKLRVGEYQELGFRYETKLKKPLSVDDDASLLDEFIAVIENNNLALGGGLNSGFITTIHRGSVTEKQRLSIKYWLETRSKFSKVIVTELTDAWYGIN